MDHTAIGGSVVSLLSTVGAFKWLHSRSVKQGEVQSEQTARLNGHDQKFEDLIRMLEQMNAKQDIILDHMMNGKK